MSQTTVSHVESHSFVKGIHGIRYQVKDVARAVAFYTQHLGFTLEHQQLPAFANIVLGGSHILLSGPGASGSRPMPDGQPQEPGGYSPRRARPARAVGDQRAHRVLETPDQSRGAVDLRPMRATGPVRSVLVMSDKPAQRFDLSVEGRAHRVEITDGALRREIRWYVDDEEVAQTKSADDKVTLKPEDADLGLVALRFSTLGRPRRVTLFEAGDEAEARVATGIGGIDLDPEPGSRAAAYEQKVREQPAGTPRSRPPAAWPRWWCRCCWSTCWRGSRSRCHCPT